MFERFTDRARAVVMLAQEEARSLRHNYIGTEHLLLGLLRENEGLGGKALTSVGVELDAFRGEVERRIGLGLEDPHGHIPFTPRAKKVLELALRQALKLAHNYIGTEHVLLGLLAEGEGVAAQILMTTVDGGLAAVRDAVFAAMGRPPEALVGIEGRLVEIGRTVRARLPRISLSTPEDELRKRLEAIEARLSVIEQLLREQHGQGETG
jgi:hypothetical protein